MAVKSIPKIQTESSTPQRVPLEEFAPDAFTVAEYTIDDVKNARTFCEAIAEIANFDNCAERHVVVGKLMLIQELRKAARP